MANCPNCGALLPAAGYTCLACGTTVPAAVRPVGPRGPPGRAQEPWVVPLLVLVTLGVYQYVWGWRVTREVDAFRQGAPDAHRSMRRGVFFGVIALVLVAAGVAAFVLTVDPAAEEVAPEDIAGLGAFMLLLLAGMAAGIAGTVFVYIGFWKVWRAIEDDDRLRGVAPISPVLMLVLLLVPYVNIVGMFYVPYRTQKGLNAMWASTGGPEVVPAPVV